MGQDSFRLIPLPSASHGPPRTRLSLSMARGGCPVEHGAFRLAVRSPIVLLTSATRAASTPIRGLAFRFGLGKVHWIPLVCPMSPSGSSETNECNRPAGIKSRLQSSASTTNLPLLSKLGASFRRSLSALPGAGRWV